MHGLGEHRLKLAGCAPRHVRVSDFVEANRLPAVQRRAADGTIIPVHKDSSDDYGGL